MLELISHHRFRQLGLPVDLSPYRNHGVASGTTALGGLAPATTAITCRNGGVVFISPAAGQWSPLVALRVEVVAKMENLGHGQPMVLVEIPQVFGFVVVEYHLEGNINGPGGGVSVMTPRPLWGPGTTLGDAWRTLTFDHNGYTGFEMRVDGQLVAQKATPLPVLPAGAVPISIGNGLGGRAPFGGRIDEVKVWRRYPAPLQHEFFCRPLSPETAACLTAIFARLREWGAGHPEALRQLARVIEQLRRTLITALLALPADVQQQLRNLLEEYERLWCSGDLTSPQMRAMLEQFVAILRKHGIDLSTNPIFQELLDLLARIPTDPKMFDCDPALAAFIELLKDIARPGGAEA